MNSSSNRESVDISENRHANPIVGELSIIEFIRVLSSYRYLVAGVALAGLAVGVAVAFLQTPIYQAEITLSPVASSRSGLSGLLDSFGGMGGIGALAAGVGGGGSSRQERMEFIATLTSPYFTRTFIEENDLLPVLFEAKWDKEKGEWIDKSPDEIPTLSDGYDFFSEEVQKVTEDDFTGLVTMSIDWKDPEVAADWANQLIDRVNELSRVRSIEQAEKTKQYLSKELEKTNIVALQQSIYYMIEQQIQQVTMANVREDFAFKVINPAVPPDTDKFIRPNRPFVIALSAFLGILAGIFIAFFTHAARRIRSQLRSGNLKNS